MKEQIFNFKFFHEKLGYRIFVTIGLSLAVGILDSFGLVMFLPLLQIAAGETQEVDPEGIGKLQFIVDGIHGFGLEMTLATVLGFLCLFFILKAIAKYINIAYRVHIQQYFIKLTRLELVHSLNSISFKYFVTSDVGRIQNTLSGEVDRVIRAFQNYFKGIEQLILVIVYMVFAFFIDAKFAILVTIGGLITNTLYSGIYKKTKGISKKLTKDNHLFQSLIIQHVANFRYLKATGQLGAYAKKLLRTIYKIEKSNRMIGLLNGILASSREPLLILVVSAAILLQTMVLGGSLAPILISLLFFYRALTSVMLMQEAYNKFLGVSGSLNNLVQFKEELRGAKEEVSHREVQTFEHEIRFENVSFSYQDDPILQDINFTLRKNETIGIVGESGSGKTTLLSLLCGLVPPNKGLYLIDDIPSTEINIKSFQNLIGYIGQDSVVFNDSIFNNVTFWAAKNEANKERFLKATKKAAISKFIQNLPQQEETALGVNGINLSGGQKQRLAIARELYKKTEILIMDEATSSLDSPTENDIQANINKLKGKYTMIIVAHRLSTIRNVDRILFMANGRIEKIGTFEELIEQQASFRRMVELQEI